MNNNSLKIQQNELFGGRFLIINHTVLGKGSFGIVYLANDTILNKICALKIEKNRKKEEPQLKNEKLILDMLHDQIGFPKVFGFGKKNKFHYLAIEPLGPNIETLFNYCRRDFSLKTILLFAIQALECIERLHNKGLIHRDIKPDNFVIGIEENSNNVYLIDYGLSRTYIEDGNHIPYMENKNLIGTARYFSINTHLRIEQSRRDDLESLGYVLLYLLLGTLPWIGVDGSTKEGKYNKILKRKLNTNLEHILTNQPIEFIMYINYVKSLKFSESPDYVYMINLFSSCLITHFPNTTNSYEFQWSMNNINKKSNKTIKLKDINTKKIDNLQNNADSQFSLQYGKKSNKKSFSYNQEHDDNNLSSNLIDNEEEEDDLNSDFNYNFDNINQYSSQNDSGTLYNDNIECSFKDLEIKEKLDLIENL